MRYLLFLALACGCSQAPTGPCAGKGITQASRFAPGSADGHADPGGAKAAGEARAGRIRDLAWIRQPENARHRVRVGDFLIANDKIAAYIEDKGESDGYMPFGGEILAIEPVAADGLPAGISQYGEMLMGLSRQAVKPETVTVLADGSDGKAAVVRVSGTLQNIPFVDTFGALSPDEFGWPAAVDYVLEPGAEGLLIRFSLMNTDLQQWDLSSNQNLGFFHRYRARTFTPVRGFANLPVETPLVAWDATDYAFAVRSKQGVLRYFIDVAGFQLFQASGLSMEACGQKSVDYLEVVPGRGLDDLLTVLRRIDGVGGFRELRGRVLDPTGAPARGAWVHAVRGDGTYLTRAPTDASGNFLLHVPAETVKLQPTLAGHEAPPPVDHAPGAAEPVLAFPMHGKIAVSAREMGSNRALPVRVQVIPTTMPPQIPDAYGVDNTEEKGRLYQVYSADGQALVEVPPGQHRVIVSRGYEYEIHDETVNVNAGQTVTVNATLLHSVDTTGHMCADFHIHSHFSVDAPDSVELKVRGAVADGLDIPVSSEHEWIIDFQPTIEKLGLKDWAFGVPSEEFTTFTWGHFGIIPMFPRDSLVNNGAVTWIGMKPPEVFQKIADLPEQPVLIVNHPSGGGFGAYFSATHFNRATGAGDPDMWSDVFGAVEVFNDSDLDANRDASVGDWFALLDAGKKVWAVGSSDSHSLRGSPIGYPRTCMRFGHDDPKLLTSEAVRNALRSGNAVVSGGLYMTVEGPGGAAPGATLPAQAGPFDVKVTVQSPSWVTAGTLEVVVDGTSTQTIQLQESGGVPGPARRYEATVTVTAPTTRALHWVVFHAKTSGKDLSPVHPGKRPFAVSNPIFF